MSAIEVPFNLAANPGTDLWKIPPAHDVSTAPTLTHSNGSIHTLLSATITFSSPYTTLYDQAGLVLTLSSPSSPPKWLKTGIEYYNSHPQLSVVATDTWSDWSIAPLPSYISSDAVAKGDKDITIKIQREKYSLWVYFVEDGEEDLPLRECTWIFGLDDEWDVEVGALVARPNEEVEGQLEATFTNFEVEWRKEC